MPLQPGTTLGSYQVTAKIGEGGMGEVYRARDTKLDRDVALKVLPQAFTDDPDRLARFEREAKVLASLNHPNIGGIHGLEESDGVRALVLEYIDGPTLADRIAQDPIPVEEALPIAKQIAEALEAAHEQGIIHRDLKPANVKVKDDGTVKVLDFGLAKAFQPDANDPSLSQSPTISLTAAATQMGMVIGTAAYMSPEQAKGKPVDKRADIWAFGAVVYEMLTGRKPFSGDDVSTTLARVIEREPDWEVLPNSLSPVLATYLRRCLAKDPKQRVHDVADVRLAMEGAFEPTTRAPGETAGLPELQFWQRPIALALFAVALVGVTGAAVWTLVRPSVSETTRLTLSAPPGVTLMRPQLSPDGRTVAFQGLDENGSQVYLRTLDQVGLIPLRGAEDTSPLAFSPDGQRLLVADAAPNGFVPPYGAAKRMPVTGGPTTMVTERHAGAAWGPDDSLAVGGGAMQGLGLVSAFGGEVTPLTTLTDGELGHTQPAFLPNGRGLLFQVTDATRANSQVAVYDFETDERTNLFLGSSPSFSPTGHLIFRRDSSLWAVPFDLDDLHVRGDPIAVIEGVATPLETDYDERGYALSDSGTLVYRPHVGVASQTLGWVNRGGEMVAILVEGAGLSKPRLSPDGQFVAFSRASEVGGDIIVWDAERRIETTRVTESGNVNNFGTWTPDGLTLTFQSVRDGLISLYSRPIDLSTSAQSLLESDRIGVPGSWTPEGDTLVYTVVHSQDDRDIWTLRLGDEPVAFLATEFQERAPKLSPNGKWVAYLSDQSGEDRVHVTAFPERGQVSTVSAGPGVEPVWSRDGRELFYRNGNQMWVAEVETESEFRAGPPRLLFEGTFVFDGAGYPDYDVSLDGQQFLMVQRSEPAESGYRVVLNWHEELTRLVPTP
jgi:hypothetical protein